MPSAHLFFDSAPEQPALSAAPSLSRLWARSDVTHRRASPQSLEARLLAAAGIQVTDAAALPIAALTALEDGLDPAGHPLRADPVCLRPDLRDVVLLPGAPPDLDRATASALIEAVNSALPDASRRLVMGRAPERWYVATHSPVALQALPPRWLAGRGIRAHLPEGPGRASWLRWLTEVEFVLHGAPANRERLTRGLPPINSLWLWGAGSPVVAPAADRPVRQPWPEAILAKALTGALSDTLAPASLAWLRSPSTEGQHDFAEPLVVVIEQPIATPAAAVTAAQQWAQPLVDALWRGRIDSITLSTPAEERRLARWHWLRLWRR